MKIFTWINRKLNVSVDYSLIAREKDAIREEDKISADYIACDKEMGSLLLDRDHASLVNALAGWPDGILAIGTFGIDQIQIEYSVDEEKQHVVGDDVDDNEEEEETPPPIAATPSFKREVRRTVPDEMLVPRPVIYEETDDPARPFLEDDEKAKKGERTTLADLFHAEADDIGKADQKCDAESNSSSGEKKAGNSKKQAPSFAKKLLQWKAEDARPATKIHRLMKKMLKRKIYPDMVHNVCDESLLKGTLRSEVEIDVHKPKDNNLCDENELASLLQGTRILHDKGMFKSCA